MRYSLAQVIVVDTSLSAITVCLAYYYIHGVDEDDADVAGVSEDAESDAEGASAVEGA